jgi:hypothetical protein
MVEEYKLTKLKGENSVANSILESSSSAAAASKGANNN